MEVSPIPPVVADPSYEGHQFAVRLRISISTLFLCLILPSSAIFVYYVYQTNYEIYKKNAVELIISHNSQTANHLVALLDPISDSLLALAKQLRDDSSLFETNRFHDTMLLHLDNNPNLVSIFTASDRGSFHQVQRMGDSMVIDNRVSPAKAKYNFWVADRSAAAFNLPKAIGQGDADKDAARPDKAKALPAVNSVFSFYENRDVLLEQFVVSNNYDPRERPFYKEMVANVLKASEIERERLVMSEEPYISTSTKRPTINISAPVIIKNKIRGMVGESFELDTISSFLKSIQFSKNSVTYIIDSQGNIIVATGPDAEHRILENALVKRNLTESKLDATRQAFGQRKANNKLRFEFQDPITKKLYLAHFSYFPNGFNSDWEVFTLAPVGDFMEGLNDINRNLIFYVGLACLLLVILTYILSRTISRPIEILTNEIRNLLDFKPHPVVRSNILEIKILSSTVKKLRSTLHAFTSYVPRDLVKDLLKSGNTITLGGESRYLTIMFTDLQDFSSISEVTPTRSLLKCVSAYLELVTYAVKEESGTVDKFIGDSVMAFWGAPLFDQNHAYHACVTAVKSQRRMALLNQRLVSEGLPPLTVRIGIHSDAVLIGNIGSPERMSYTVMGDGVNIASRLEGINKEFGTRTCISLATFKEAGERLWTRPIDVITVKGRQGGVTVFELVGIRNHDDETNVDQRGQDLCEATQKAFMHFSQKQYAEATTQYQEIADKFNDNVARIMVRKCQQYQRVSIVDTAILPSS